MVTVDHLTGRIEDRGVEALLNDILAPVLGARLAVATGCDEVADAVDAAQIDRAGLVVVALVVAAAGHNLLALSRREVTQVAPGACGRTWVRLYALVCPGRAELFAREAGVGVLALPALRVARVVGAGDAVVAVGVGRAHADWHARTILLLGALKPVVAALRRVGGDAGRRVARVDRAQVAVVDDAAILLLDDALADDVARHPRRTHDVRVDAVAVHAHVRRARVVVVAVLAVVALGGRGGRPRVRLGCRGHDVRRPSVVGVPRDVSPQTP